MADRERNKTGRALFEALIASTRDGIYVTDRDGRCIMVNQAFCDMTGYSQKELVGARVSTLLIDGMDERMYQQVMDTVSSYNEQTLFESLWRHKSGTLFPVELRYTVLTDAEGDYNGIAVSVRDITARKSAMEQLRRSHAQLEEQVRQGAVSVAEVNTAFRVLLAGREDDLKAAEARLQATVNELVLPCLNRLKMTRLDERQRSFVALIEANLADIMAPLISRNPPPDLSLTPSEVQVANMIKQGMTAKEIAAVTGLAPRSIERLRTSIRKKLGITHARVTLREYLQSAD